VSQAAGPGEPDEARRSLSWRLLAPVIFVLAGVLFAASEATSHGADLRGGRLTQLSDLIRNVDQRNSASERQIVRLREEVAGLSESLSQDQLVAQARAQAKSLENPAGLSAVSGNGLAVTLNDAPPDAADRRLPGLPPPSPDDLVVHQQDVQAVVNALWSGGAEAMQIMDQRVIATSAVRCVGNTLILQGRVYSPPYKVLAIGDATRMRNALKASPKLRLYRQYVDAYGLGYRIEERRAVKLSGYSGTLDLQYAEVPSS
jgi:uncharacterized protein YlxW (UPF0749 family)